MSNSSGVQIKEEIRNFIVSRYFQPGQDTSIVKDDASLVMSSIIDSLDKQELVVHVKRHYGIEVDPYEETTDFESINSIAEFVVRKTESRKAA